MVRAASSSSSIRAAVVHLTAILLSFGLQFVCAACRFTCLPSLASGSPSSTSPRPLLSS
ncbi:hypothetical protein ACP70R_024882 [Stipagrostis hirtigluma subsp. patula]